MILGKIGWPVSVQRTAFGCYVGQAEEVELFFWARKNAGWLARLAMFELERRRRLEAS